MPEINRIRIKSHAVRVTVPPDPAGPMLETRHHDAIYDRESAICIGFPWVRFRIQLYTPTAGIPTIRDSTCTSTTRVASSTTVLY